MMFRGLAMTGKTCDALFDDFGTANSLCLKAMEVERNGGDATALYAEANRLTLAIAGHFVAQELPDVNFPPTAEGEMPSWVCGGYPHDKRRLCEHLVWLYGFHEDAHHSREGAIYEALMHLLMFSDAALPQCDINSPERPTEAL